MCFTVVVSFFFCITWKTVSHRHLLSLLLIRYKCTVNFEKKVWLKKGFPEMLGMSCKTWYISNANKLGRGRVLGVFYIHLFKQKILLNMYLIFKALDNNFALSSAIPFHLDLAVRNTTFSFIHQFLNFEMIFSSFFTILSSFCP